MSSPTPSPTPAATVPADDVALVVRLPRDLRDALKDRARAEDRSVASLLRVAARMYLSTELGATRRNG